ncbi:MAG: cellulase family glycosylhydrolase [Thermoleophilaceae bacterium]
MRGRLLAVCVALGCALLAAASSATAAEPLSHSGRWLTDSDGRVVVLHGVNMVSKRPPFEPEAVGFSADDAAFLAEHGFNTARVGVIYAALEPRPGEYDDAYLDSIQRTVDLLAQHGIHSQLDFHQDLYNQRFGGEGFPDWATHDDGLPAQPRLGFPANYLAMPALWRAFDHFWANDFGLQDRYAAAWRHVAARFAGHPFVMGYDLMNEPWPGSAWPTCVVPEVGCPLFDAGPLTSFSKRMIAAIRQADPDGLVWYEPNVIFNSGVPTRHGDTGDPNAGFSFHNYCLAAGVVPGVSLPPELQDPVCGLVERDFVFAHAEEHSRRTGDALLLSEFGASDDLGLLRRLVEGADEYRLSWQYWHYCTCADPTTSGGGGAQSLVEDPAQPPTGANVKKAKLDVLARPFPRAVAGTPESWAFDPASRAFTLQYATRRADGGSLAPGLETEVFLPPRHYPGTYEVDVTGASVTSPPGARVLRLVAGPDSTRVSIRVRPA